MAQDDKPSFRQERRQRIRELRQRGCTTKQIARTFAHDYHESMLKAFRWAHDWTLAEAAGNYNNDVADDPEHDAMSFHRLSTYENWPRNANSHPPKLTVLQGFAKLYQCAPGDLVEGADYTPEVERHADELHNERDGGPQPRLDRWTHSELHWLGTGQGAASGAVLRTFEATHPGELRRVIGLPNVSAAKIERLEHAADHYARIYATKTPSMIGEQVTDHYHAVERLLDGSQQHRRRLLAVAGRFAGLMSWLAFDTHRPALAHAYLDVGIAAAEQAKDKRLAAYLAASRNRIATLTDDHASILAAGEEARSRAEGEPYGRLAAWIFAIEGRGLAGLGRLHEAETAFAASEAALAKAQGDEPGMAFFDSVRLRALIGESYVLLDRPQQATGHLGEALRDVAPARAKTHAMVLLDSARAAIQRRDHDEARALLEQACSIDRPALVATHAQRVAIIERTLAATRTG